MKKYGNYYDDNDVSMPSMENYLGQVISRINSSSDIIQVCKVLKGHAFDLYGEAHHHQQINKLCLGNNIYVDAIIFEYNSRPYYWWDMYRGNEYMKSALEFKARFGSPFVTHVWFATDLRQPPFIWTLKNHIDSHFK